MPKCANPDCKKHFVPRFSSFQKVCEEPACILWWSAQTKAKEFKKWKGEIKEKHKTHSDYENELQPLVNKICRLIDKGQPCICCDKMPLKANAGHRFSVGSNNSLRFNLQNLHISCNRCNEQLSGNPDGYDEGLIRVYGQDYFNLVKWELKKTYPLVKLSTDELTKAKEIARQIIKELEKLDLVYPAEMRVRLRNEYNKRIGIYR